MVGRSLKPFRRPWLWSGLWSIAIATVVVFSLIPAPQLPDLPPGGDKWEHFLAYAALAAYAVQLYDRWPSLLGAGLSLALLGIGLEHAQGALTETRMMDRWDALANTLGVIAGLATRMTPWRDALLNFDLRRA
ncbi:VanZ family protein [Luteimonas gilva]|uniref:VanZ family protein n=1 Tax=Luteimonas gilva TaxID=2572684 RepID=A0A4U5JJQ1_9GAMM|nr:VanZ family protein [Luteimonas gilva]TKR29820.1 VanZ family protein [Luteimonas gilva]